MVAIPRVSKRGKDPETFKKPAAEPTEEPGPLRSVLEDFPSGTESHRRPGVAGTGRLQAHFGCEVVLLHRSMLLEHERNYGLGIDALVTICSWNTSRNMVWA